MSNKEVSNTITIDDEVIDTSSLSHESKLYLDHLLDIEHQLQTLTFKTQQLNTAKAAFVSLFTKSRDNKQKE
jgi:hypothetical protein